jgi:hypothetical protein
MLHLTSLLILNDIALILLKKLHEKYLESRCVSNCFEGTMSQQYVTERSTSEKALRLFPSLMTTMIFLATVNCGIRVLETIIVIFVGIMSIALFIEMDFAQPNTKGTHSGMGPSDLLICFEPKISSPLPESLGRW